ncbi:MAG TPA: uracil-DNA glycosylase [Nitrososphaerales archaeon]|nr:uracil-DNA glycosylase [Nitrososphaerales archaeon]
MSEGGPPGEGVPSAAGSLSLVSEEVRRCTRCPLSLTRTNGVPGEGPSDAAVVLIGEGPGRNEDLQGRPFVGAAGKQLDGLLKEAGLGRDEVYITNVVKCRPPGNRRPTDAEADSCHAYLERQLELIRPMVVVLMGDSALKRFLPGESLASSHGRLIVQGGLALFPTYHPAAMIYNRALEKVSSDDFRALGKVLSGLRAEQG